MQLLIDKGSLLKHKTLFGRPFNIFGRQIYVETTLCANWDIIIYKFSWAYSNGWQSLSMSSVYQINVIMSITFFFLQCKFITVFIILRNRSWNKKIYLSKTQNLFFFGFNRVTTLKIWHFSRDFLFKFFRTRISFEIECGSYTFSIIGNYYWLLWTCK